MNRREFLQNCAGAAALAAAGSPVGLPQLQAAETPPKRKTIGIQVGAVSFADEGTDKVLDLLQERGAVDTVYPVVFGRLSARRIFSGPSHIAGSVSFFCGCRHLSVTRP
jgi:hypothetical protein